VGQTLHIATDEGKGAILGKERRIVRCSPHNRMVRQSLLSSEEINIIMME
jgi:hypothetical protein